MHPIIDANSIELNWNPPAIDSREDFIYRVAIRENGSTVRIDSQNIQISKESHLKLFIGRIFTYGLE